MDKQKNNLIRSLSIVIVIVWLFIVMINATLSFTEGDAFIDHCLVWSTLSLAFSLFALRVAGKDKEKGKDKPKKKGFMDKLKETFEE